MNIFSRWGARNVLIGFAVVALGFFHSAQAAGNPVRLTMTPAAVSVEAGKTAVFTVTGIDGANESRDVTIYSSLSNDDPYGNMAQSTYTAGKTGTWTVTATMAGLSATSTVTVTPGPLATLIVNPDSSPEILAPTEHRTFSVLAYDSLNNRLNAPDILWSVEGNIGTVDQTGRFTATRIGTGTLRAQGPNNLSDTITVKVRESAVVSTNTNTVTTTNGNTNQSTNTSSNTNSVPGDDTQIVATTTATTTETPCSSFTTLQWNLLLAAYALLTAGFYVMIRTSGNSWWWLPPALLTAIGLWLFSDRRCGTTYAWWPYALLGIGVFLGAVYLWLRPRREQLEMKL